MFVRNTIIFLVFSMMVSCANRDVADSLNQAYEKLAQCLGDSQIPYEKRARAARLLAEGDKWVIPVLIEHLNDTRVYNPHYIDISETADANRNIIPRVVTVGEECDSLLYVVVYGYWERYMPPRIIDNWEKWWHKNKDRSMADIMKEVEQQLRPYLPEGVTNPK